MSGSTGSTGRRLGPYRLGRRIAIGGMAEIFDAERADGEGPPIVVKRLLPDQAKDPEIVRMLEHEGQLMRRLAHDNLLRVVDVDATGDEPYLVLERIDGVAASEILDVIERAGERPSAAMALALVLPLLDALAYVHAATDPGGAAMGVVHRDVTPHNVLVSRHGEVKLGDFGIARSSLRDARTRTGVIKGKLRYLAPEQVTGSDLDARTDLYAASVILWELLAGEPYLSADSDALLVRAAESPSFRPTGDERFDPILKKALARFLEARPRDAASLRAQLADAGADLDLEAGRAAWAAQVEALVGAVPDEPRAVAASPSRPWGPIALGLAVALGVGGVAFLSLTDPAPLPMPDRPGDVTRGAPSPEASRSPADPLAAPSPSPSPTPVASPDLEAAPSPPEPAPPSPPRSEPSARRRREPPHAPVVVEPTPLPPAPDPELDVARSELGALRQSLRARGIRTDDLSRAQRAALSAVDAALAAEDAAQARARLASVRQDLEALSVDEAFVRAKLERVDRRIRAMRARGQDTTEIERLSALALEDLLARRPEATNRRLNQILRQLAN